MPTNRKVIALGAFVFAASSVAARLTLLFDRPLWHDEVFTLWAARLSFPALVRALAHDSGPPLFYLAERPLAAWADSSGFDALVRLLPLLSTVLLFAAAAWLSGGAGRLAFIALAGSSPLLLVYAAEARAYATLSLLLMALFLLLFEARPSTASWLLAALVTALALGTHYLAIFALAAAATWLAIRRAWRPLAAVLTGALVFVPWLPVLRAQPPEATAWMREGTASALLSVAASLGGAGRIPDPLGGPLAEPILWIGAAVGIGLAALLLVRARGGQGSGRDALAVAGLTVAFVFVASTLRPVVFPGRTEMAVLPFWLWSVARAAETSRAARWLAAAAVAIGLASCVRLISVPRPEASAEAANAVVVHAARPGDALLATSAFYLPARLALDRGRLHAELTALPSELALHPGWIPARPLGDADYADLEKALARLPPGRRAYLLAHPILVTPRLLELLAARGAVARLLERPDALVLSCTAR